MIMQAEQSQYRQALDWDIKRRFLNFLNTCGVRGWNELEVQVTDGTVLVRGHLLSAHEKRLCIDNCRYLSGVVTVIDEVQVPLS